MVREIPVEDKNGEHVFETNVNVNGIDKITIDSTG